MICAAARISIRGSCAVIAQRRTPLAAPIITRTVGDTVKRGEIAKITISAITPSDHNTAMVTPLNPAFCQVIAEKP